MKRYRTVLLAIMLAMATVLGSWGGFGGVPAVARAADQCFPQTGKCVGGEFYAYWLANGGLAQQGLPISEAFDEVSPTNGRTYRVQYFERARFEAHPENQPPYTILLGLLGREQFLVKYPNGRPPTNLEGRPDYCFIQTSRCVGPRFLAYWQANGGLAQQGLPLSDEFDEVNPTDGKTYRTQYFERARFEYHPEQADPQYQVLLGLLGREQFLAKYPSGQPTGPAPSPLPSASPTPAPSATPSPSPSPTPAPGASPTPAPGTSPTPAPPAFDPSRYIGQGDRYNCADFASQARAQAVLRADPRDPNKLDTDKDGIACEANPAPRDLNPVPR